MCVCALSIMFTLLHVTLMAMAAAVPFTYFPNPAPVRYSPEELRGTLPPYLGSTSPSPETRQK